MAHDERPCLLCLFFHRPCGFSGFGCSLGGISGSLTGVFGGGILPFDEMCIRDSRYTNDKHPKQIYSCKTYNAYGKQHCTQHRVEYDTCLLYTSRCV